MKPSLINKIAFLLILTSMVLFVYARSTGITGRTKLSSSPGCTCHSASSSMSVSVSIDGPAELETDSSGTYTVTITGGPLSAAGVNIAADNATLDIVDSDLQKIGAELTHTSPKSPSGGAVTFSFQVTAPSQAGTAEIAATGNSVNLSGSNSGDAWNHALNKSVNIKLPSAIATTEASYLPQDILLDQNYPNPFNPATTIAYSLPRSAMVRLEIFNMLGQRLEVLADGWQTAGQHRAVFNAGNLESGTYFYRLSVEGKSSSRRMLLLK